MSYFSERGVLEDNDISAACYSLSSSNLLREVVKSTEIVILRSSRRARDERPYRVQAKESQRRRDGNPHNANIITSL